MNPWKEVILGDICNQRSELVQPGTVAETRFLGLEHIASGEPTAQSFGSSKNLRSSKFHFYPGDILYGKLRPYLDKCVLATFEGISSTDLIALKANEAMVLPEFVVHILHTNRFLGHAISTTTGTNHPRTNWTQLSRFRLMLPPILEQRRIIDFLSRLGEELRIGDELIAGTIRLKAALLKELMKGGIEPVHVKETVIGTLPSHWRIVSIRDICDLKNGFNFPADQKHESGTLTVDVLNMYGDGLGINLSNIYRVKIKQERLADYALRPGDILLVRSSMKREGAAWASLFEGHNEPVSFCGFIIRARPRTKEILPKFLAYYLRGTVARSYLLSTSGQVAITNITQESIGLLKIPLPPVVEQEKISNVLSQVDEKIALEKAKKKTLVTLRNKFLNDLAMGQVRHFA